VVRPNAGTKGVPRLDRETQILDIASEQFGTHGFAATSVAAIAERAGISKPLIYNYFGSKEGLYEACLDRGGALLADEGVTELMGLAGNDDALDISAMTAVWLGIVDSLMNWWMEHPDESADQMVQRCLRLLKALFGGTE
jgi:AcrR family transcriptional regulator